MDPGQSPMKNTVKRTAAVQAVIFAARNFLMTISRGGRSWKFSPSSRMSSPLYLVTQGEGVVNVPGLVPLRLLHLRGQPPPGDEGDNDTGSSANRDGHHVACQHWQFLAGVLDESSSRETPWESGGIRKPGGHSREASTHHTAHEAV